MNIQKIAVQLFNSSPSKIRKVIYRLCRVNTNNADIRDNVMISQPNNLLFGKNVLINCNSSFVFGAGDSSIVLGDNVQIGPSCVFTTISHDYSDPIKRAGTITYKNIIVGRGSWICSSCTILPGVTIGKGCVIAAGSVVNKNIPDNQLWGGVPAHFIKELPTA